MSKKLKRYWHLLMKSKFGLSLSPAAISNYLTYYILPRSEMMKPSWLSPIMLSLLVTSRCNFNCSFCVLAMQKSNASTERLNDMDVDLVGKIMSTEIAKKVLVVVLSGGEPLLNGAITDIVRFVKKSNKVCGMITNGSLLPRYIEPLKREGIDDIQLSVYRDYLSVLRGTLPNLCKEFPINASYTLLRSEIEESPEEVEEIIDFCQKSGCKSLKFSLCVPYNDNYAETIYDDTGAWLTFQKRVKEKFKDFKVFLPLPVSRKIKSKADKKCFMPWQLLLVDALGRMAMCCGYEGIKDAPCNIFSEDDRNSYNHHVLLTMRKKLLSNDSDIHEKCRNCPHRSGSFASRL